MKKLIALLLLIACLSSVGQVVTTKIVKVANNTTLFNENLVKDIEILDIANKRIYQTLKAIPANKSISTCVIDVDLKELQSNVVKAKNGLHIVSNDLRDTIKLGGTLTEPTTISQNGRTFKILDAGHGSVFGSSGIAYTKIDTASFVDSTLITKLYAKKYKLKNDSVLPSGYATNYKVDEFFVPYRNAHDSLITSYPIKSTQFILDTAYTTTGVEPIGSMFWDEENSTFTTVLKGVRLQNGQELQMYGKNTSGVLIKNGYPVSLTANPAQFSTFERTDITNSASAQAFIGIATQDIGINEFGYVTLSGQVRDIPDVTVGLIEKQPVYVSATPPYLSSSLPQSPNYVILVGNCERAHIAQGRINVNSSVTPKLKDLTDVDGTPLTTKGQIPVWDQNRQVFDFNYNIWPDIVSNAAYSTLWNGEDSIAASKNAVYDKIETLTPIRYCPTTMTVNKGTLIQGTVSDLCSVGGTDVIISENTGTDPLRVTFEFIPVQRLTSFSFYGRYAGGASHVTYLEAYNYTLAEWQLIGELGNTATKQWQSYNIFLPTNFISSGTVQVRFNHQGNGINTHQLILDYVDVNYGGAGGSSFETASEIAYIPEGNVSSTNVQAAITELDAEKVQANTAITAATKTKLTYDSKGLVTAGADATTTDISEGTNLYFTNARARSSLSLTTTGNSGASTYNNATGVFNIPNYTLAGLGGQPLIDGTGFVKASGTTISYDNSTYLPFRTFGTAANNNTGDFILNNNSSAQNASIWVSGSAAFGSAKIIGNNYPMLEFYASSNLSSRLLYYSAPDDKLYYRYGGLNDGEIYHSGNSNTSSVSWNASQFQLTGKPLLLDWLKSGSAPLTTQVLVGGGTTSAPVGITGTEGQVLKIVSGVPQFAASTGGLPEDPYIAPSNSSYTLDRSTYIHSSSSTNTNITITLSNLGNGNSGNIEVKYTGAAVVTFVVNSSYTIDMADQIWNTTTNAYTKSVTSMSSGTASYSYWRVGNNVKIHGTQYYQ